MSKKILIISDAPSMHSGLARISKDITYMLLGHGADVRCLGLNWAVTIAEAEAKGEPKPEFDWHVYNLGDINSWGARDLNAIYIDAIVNGSWKPDVVFTIYDPQRMHTVARVAKQFGAELWGYFPIDSHNPGQKLTGIGYAALTYYDRILAYGPYGAKVIKNSDPEKFTKVSWLPHGLHDDWFTPVTPNDLGSHLLTVQNWSASIDYSVGAVCTNQHRKDYGTLFAMWGELKLNYSKQGKKIGFWLHTDIANHYWSVPHLAETFGLGEELLVTEDLNDSQLKFMYNLCDVTVLPSLGEGFGYPLVESLACGTPVLHTNFAGGVDYVPAMMRIPVAGTRLDGFATVERPIMDFRYWTPRVVELLRWIEKEPEVVNAYCRGAVEHLKWSRLGPRWDGWIRRGLATT